MFITPDLINAVAKINPIFLEGTLKIASAEAKSIGFDDDLIYSEIIEKKQNMVRVDCQKTYNPFQKWKDDNEKINY